MFWSPREDGHVFLARSTKICWGTLTLFLPGKFRKWEGKALLGLESGVDLRGSLLKPSSH